MEPLDKYIYDTRGGLLAYLYDFPTLTRVIAARSNAKSCGELLAPFVVMGGRFMLTDNGTVLVHDTCGQLHERLPFLPMVLEASEFSDYLLQYGVSGANTFSSWGDVPTLAEHCAHCGQGWSAKNCHDFYRPTIEELGSPHAFAQLFHRGCYGKLALALELRVMQEAFAEAGIDIQDIVPVDNPKPTGRKPMHPWFWVDAEFGRLTWGRFGVASVRIVWDGGIPSFIEPDFTNIPDRNEVQGSRIECGRSYAVEALRSIAAAFATKAV